MGHISGLEVFSTFRENWEGISERLGGRLKEISRFFSMDFCSFNSFPKQVSLSGK